MTQFLWRVKIKKYWRKNAAKIALMFSNGDTQLKENIMQCNSAAITNHMHSKKSNVITTKIATKKTNMQPENYCNKYTFALLGS